MKTNKANEVSPTHTPTPWRQSEINPMYVLDDARGEIIAECQPHYVDKKSKENAAFIVRAVNAHDELLAALKKIREMVQQCNASNAVAVQEYLRSGNGAKAIAKAEGK